MATKKAARKGEGKHPSRMASVESAPAYLLPEPIKVETHQSKRGERMTTLTFSPPFTHPVTHSADRFFADARECPAMLIDQAVWFVIMPWLQNEPQVVRDFWLKFNTPKACQNRMRAVSGKKSDSWKNERAIVQMVHATRRLLTSTNEQCDDPTKFPLEMTFLVKLGEWVMNAVESDREALTRLHALLKDPSASEDKTNRDHIPRNLFNAFVALVATEERLPTKKAVREKAYLGGKHAHTIASREYGPMGLSGLPRG